MRRALKRNDWKLIAGEYPGGSDDELYVLSIMDPEIARDNSPDPRRHSEGEIIPDLFAYKDDVILVIEAKPKYDVGDRDKLKKLFDEKMNLLQESLLSFCTTRGISLNLDPTTLRYVPVLAFENQSLCPVYRESGFAHIYVKDLNEVSMYYFKDKEDFNVFG